MTIRRAGGPVGALALLLAPAAGIAAGVAAAPVGAADPPTITVTTTADVDDPHDGLTSLREAVDDANAAAGPHQIVLAAGASYELTGCGPLFLADEVRIVGEGASLTAPCGGLFESEGAVTLTDLALVEGPVDVVDGSLHLVDVTVTGSLEAIEVDNGAELTIDGGTLAGNGVAVVVRDGAVTLVDAEVVDNGTGISASSEEGTVDIALFGSHLTGNDDAVAGPVPGDVQLVDTVLEGNGWGISEVDGMLAMTDSSIRTNVVGVAHAETLVMLRSEISDNDERGIHAVGGYGTPVDPVVSLVDSTITGNGGNGLAVYGGAVAVTRSTIADNAGTGLVQGYEWVEGETGGPVTLVDSTIAGNGALLSAGDEPVGGVLVRLGSLSATNATIAGNHGDVGGVRVDEGQAAVIRASTVAGNEGALVDDLVASAITLDATLVGDGTVGAPNCSLAAAVDAAHVYDADGSCGLPVDAAGGPGPVDLGPLADNGGPTLTRLPAPSSSLLDGVPAGDPTCVPTDQRGTARPQGSACDIGAVEVGVPEGAPHFPDVGVSHPFFWEVECLVALDATEGYADGTFRPGSAITRQAVVAWLWRLAGEPAPSGDPPFVDVTSGQPFGSAIAWAAEQGVAAGYPDGTFRPGAPITRQALAAWLWRRAGEPPAIVPPVFTDVPLGHPFGEAIAWLAASGVSEGYDDGSFRPSSAITRMAVAAWTCRAEVRGLS